MFGKLREDACDKRILFIAWEKHRRTIELCRFFQIDNFLFSIRLPRVVKHPLLILFTVYILSWKRPRILIVQNPSIILSLLSCILKPVFRYKLIVDAHNAAISPENLPFVFLQNIYSFVQKHADVTIVTNYYLAEKLKKNNGNPFVLPDKIPNVDCSSLISDSERKEIFDIVFICSFSDDEPYHEVFDAFSQVEFKTCLYVTGSIKNDVIRHYNELFGNVVFTGYLVEQEYFSLLCSADLVIDLTTRDDCLVCGAYEAVAVGVPLMVSGTKILREYFKGEILYTDNSVDSILSGINYAYTNQEELRRKMSKLKSSLNADWKKYAFEFSNQELSCCS